MVIICEMNLRLVRVNSKPPRPSLVRYFHVSVMCVKSLDNQKQLDVIRRFVWLSNTAPEANLPLNDYDRLKNIFEATSAWERKDEDLREVTRRELVASFLTMVGSSQCANLSTMAGGSEEACPRNLRTCTRWAEESPKSQTQVRGEG